MHEGTNEKLMMTMSRTERQSMSVQMTCDRSEMCFRDRYDKLTSSLTVLVRLTGAPDLQRARRRGYCMGPVLDSV